MKELGNSNQTYINDSVTTLMYAHCDSKKWDTHIVPHNSHKNRVLWIKLGTVNRKSISYNLPLKLLMQQSTSCSHCHDNHRACTAIEYLCQVTPEFVSSDLCPPNSPDLNPVDYRVWGCLQDRVYQKRVCDVELKQRLTEVWSHFSQPIIDAAIDEWRKRLLACIRMKGHHFEHLT